MLRTVLRMALALVVGTTIWSAAPTGSRLAQAIQPNEYRRSRTGDLFYNYYVGPSYDGGAPAQLYLSPRPTPPLVGHTYITYQPMMPHEFLYRHQRTYYTRHAGAGLTRTQVHWW